MDICFISQNGHVGKLPRSFMNTRTEFAWQIALDAYHYSYNDWLTSTTFHDLIIVILPKKFELIDTEILLDSIKKRSNKIAVMQEGPCWYYQDYDYKNQVGYINFLNEVDFLLVHNKTDISYFKGIFKKPTYCLQSLIIEDTIKDIVPQNNGHPIIGGNFCSWYGGVDSYFVARNFNKDIYIPSMGRKINNEEHFPNLKHLPYMQWTQWMYTLSQFNVGVHLMRTHAAGTFALNCAYFGIPCIGYNGLDTQEKLHNHLTVKVGDIEKANYLANKLRDDKEFYNFCSQNTRDSYIKLYSESIWMKNWNIIYENVNR